MQVVAALIERNGKLLICQRKEGQRHALKWEFPGGKVEPGEGSRAALERELTEELAIRAAIGEEVARYDYTYPGRSPIELVFYSVTKFEGEPENRIFEQIRWELPANLPDFNFLEGDIEFVRILSARAAGENRRSAPG